MTNAFMNFCHQDQRAFIIDIVFCYEDWAVWLLDPYSY